MSNNNLITQLNLNHCNFKVDKHLVIETKLSVIQGFSQFFVYIFMRYNNNKIGYFSMPPSPSYFP